MAEIGSKAEKKPRKKTEKIAKAEDKIEDKMKKEEIKNNNNQMKTEIKQEAVKKDENKTVESSVVGDNKEEKKDKKKEQPKIIKKEIAVARAKNVHMSKKHGMYISSFIKNKSIDNAIADLEQVIKLKKIVPFKGEIPHRKGPGMMSGRYPVNASKIFITTLKGLKGNVIVNGMDLEKTRIITSATSWASRPARSGGRRFKRCHLVITAKEANK